MLAFYISMIYNSNAIWVWRSLVARLNGVQEVGGSSPFTHTRKRLRIVINLESFSIISAFDGINPHQWMKSLRDEIYLIGRFEKVDMISSEVTQRRFHPNLFGFHPAKAGFHYCFSIDFVLYL